MMAATSPDGNAFGNPDLATLTRGDIFADGQTTGNQSFEMRFPVGRGIAIE
ncbi:hypothetical protein [Luteolibacter flavescens]|uniref:hypothetical protein n=1 Tax=Luteolibacter flavescens TaxID=1859460 RepID=UPI002222CD51|nr:hypothetical protein [Luteolibacter flavescens]